MGAWSASPWRAQHHRRALSPHGDGAGDNDERLAGPLAELPEQDGLRLRAWEGVDERLRASVRAVAQVDALGTHGLQRMNPSTGETAGTDYERGEHSADGGRETRMNGSGP